MMRPFPHLLTLLLLAAATPALPAFGAEAASAPAIEQRAQRWFGVAVENIPPSIAKLLKLKPGQGLMVSAVLPNSPAQRAGLRTDDLLIEINDKPLTTQQDLYRAANPKEAAKAVAPSRLTYIREGDRQTVEITSAPRPAEMIFFDTQDKPNAMPVRNYVIPNGNGAQVGTGIRINLANSDPSDFSVNSIQQMVSKGQTVILSQETDIAGNVKRTITVDKTVYTVDPQNLEALPEDLRPLAERLVNGPAKPSIATRNAPQTAASLEQRVKELEEKNALLTKRLEQLLDRDDRNAPRK
jgi:membrane-associated protease RseP (regulator of RpoE activity)